MRSPAAGALATVSTPRAAALVTTATRSPGGSGWPATSRPTSNSSATVSTRITPELANRAATPRASGPMLSASSAGGRTGLATAATGLRRASSRAIRANLRGLPKVSRYSRTASVCGSSRQYCRASLPETSARLPAETKVDRPSPRRSAAASSAVPSAADWLKKPTRPGRGSSGASVALSRTPGSVLAMPRQFGPISRMPWLRTARSSAACASAPAGPASAKPADTTTSPCTPAAAQSSTTPGTASAGTATTARSMFAVPLRLVTAGRPPTTAADGWTGTSFPPKAALLR